VVINLWFNATHPAGCDDCHLGGGIPFAFYDAGGFAGENGILWFGLAGDLALVHRFGRCTFLAAAM